MKIYNSISIPDYRCFLILISFCSHLSLHADAFISTNSIARTSLIISTSSTSNTKTFLKNQNEFSNQIKNRSHYLVPTTSTTTSIFSSPSDTADNSSSSSDDGKQGLSTATFNLVKAAIGSGVFALPAGVAAFSDVPSALIPASLLMFVLGTLSAYSFHMVGRLSHTETNNNTNNQKYDTKTKSLSAAWEDEVGKNSSWIISAACFLTPLGAALTYSIILGDLFSTFAKTAGMTGFLATRQASILALTSSILYPLCNLKSLAALSPVSILAVTGMFMSTAFMFLRALPGSPYTAGGVFLNTLPMAMRPSFGVKGGSIFSPSSLVLVSMAATAYLTHFSAPDFYDGLKKPSLKRFGLLSAISYTIVTLLNIIIMSCGFLTFGGASSGMILNNYAAKDIGATLCRVVVAISLIGSYPIMMRAVKSSFFELFQKGKEVTEKASKNVTTALLSSTAALALILEDAGFMVSLNGALMGSAIIYAFPSIIFLKMTNRLVKKGEMKQTKLLIVERLFNRGLIALGGVLGILGALVTVMTTFFPGKL